MIQNKGKENNHFAATMLRNKIQKEFRELPENSHLSLRDSLLKHLELYREGSRINFSKYLSVHRSAIHYDFLSHAFNNLLFKIQDS